MSEFADGLIAETNGWASAYIEFVTGAGREPFQAYVFVEDVPDIDLYKY